ncbi:MAG: nicotinate-nucleotide adenylyltransferase [Xenococcaceae cyanobacterium]
MKKIALFGTSADPPTEGHQTILKWLSDRYDWVAVWASDNPFKEHQASLSQRMQMLRLAIAEIETEKNNLKVYEELSDRRSSIAVDKAKKIWGEEAEYSLVIGSDLVKQISKWYRVEELLQKAKVLIVPRPGYAIDRKDLETLQILGGRWAIADLDVPAVSSTAFREQKNERVVATTVKDYIYREKLYIN